jgi:hypothetical protein
MYNTVLDDIEAELRDPKAVPPWPPSRAAPGGAAAPLIGETLLLLEAQSERRAAERVRLAGQLGDSLGVAVDLMSERSPGDGRPHSSRSPAGWLTVAACMQASHQGAAAQDSLKTEGPIAASGGAPSCDHLRPQASASATLQPGDRRRERCPAQDVGRAHQRGATRWGGERARRPPSAPASSPSRAAWGPQLPRRQASPD